MKDYSGTDLKIGQMVFFAWGDPEKTKPGSDCIYTGEVVGLYPRVDTVKVSSMEEVDGEHIGSLFSFRPWELQLI